MYLYRVNNIYALYVACLFVKIALNIYNVPRREKTRGNEQREENTVETEERKG